MHMSSKYTSSKLRSSVITIGVAALLGLSACGSDEKSSSSDKTETTDEQSSEGTESVDNTLADVSAPAGGVGNLSSECLGYFNLFSAAFAGDASGVGDIDEAIESLQSQVPDELKGDVEKVATFFAKLLEVSEKYEGNPTAAYSDPELLAFFGDPEYAAASERVNAWLTTECGTG